MKVFEEELTLDRGSQNKHIYFPFVLENGGKRLTVSYSYSPKFREKDELSRKLVADAFLRSGITASAEEIENELPICNHVTLSVIKEGVLLGTAHRHASQSVYEVSEELSSPGFHLAAVTAGEWAIVLSVHSAVTDKINAKITVEVE